MKRIVALGSDGSRLRVAATLLPDDYDQLPDEDRARIPDQYGLCLTACVGRIAAIFRAQGIKEPVDYVFESGDDGEGTVKARLEEIFRNPASRTKYAFDRADLDAGLVLDVDTRLSDDIRHGHSPLSVGWRARSGPRDPDVRLHLLHDRPPSIDPVGVVASGSALIGNVASIGVLVSGRSRGVPLKAFATAFQRHPFAFFFLRDSGIKTPADFAGKTIGIQGTARPLLDAVLAKYQVPRDKVNVIIIGGTTTPLLTK